MVYTLSAACSFYEYISSSTSKNSKLKKINIVKKNVSNFKENLNFKYNLTPITKTTKIIYRHDFSCLNLKIYSAAPL